MAGRRAYAALGLTVVVVLGAFAFARADRAAAAPPLAPPAPPPVSLQVAEAAPAPLPVAQPSEPAAPPRESLEGVRAALADPSSAGTERLLRALDGEDEVAKLEAIDGLVERRHLPLIDRLLRLDPSSDPYLGPTILVSLGALGSHASPRDRRAVADRLVSLLAAEKARGGTDSAGNIVTIIESLGVLGDPAGAEALERELVDRHHDLANQTTIVKSLGLLGQRSSVVALERFRAGLTVGDKSDPFERELETELVSTLDSVSAKLRGG